MFFGFALFGLFILSAGTILVLLIRALPRVDGTVAERGILERWLTSAFPEKVDAFLNLIFLRSLRRAKVWVLKIDNALNRKMEKLKLERGEGIRVERPNSNPESGEEIGG